MFFFNQTTQKTLFMSIPIIATGLIGAAVGIVSMYLIALLGHEALAAGALISSTYSFLIMIAISLFLSVSIMIGQHYGAGKIIEIGAIVRHGWFLATLIAIPLIFVMRHIYPILIFFKQPETISKYVAIYFKGLSYGIFPTMWGVVTNQFLNAILRPKIVMFFSALALICNSILGYLLLLGKCGFPALGIIGVAYAISFVSWISFAALLIYLAFNKKFQSFKIFQFLKSSPRFYLRIFQLGWPISFQFGIEMLAFTAMTYFMGTLGPVALAAQQIVLQCSMIAIMIMAGFSQATSILIGQNIGKRNFENCYEQYHSSLALIIVAMLLISAIYIFAPTFLISFFLDIKNPSNQAIIHLTTILFFITAITQVFDGIRNVTTSALRGYSDTRFPMIMGLISCWIIAMPLAIFFTHSVGWGPAGIRIGFLIGIAIGAVILIQRFYFKTEGYKLFEPIFA